MGKLNPWVALKPWLTVDWPSIVGVEKTQKLATVPASNPVTVADRGVSLSTVSTDWLSIFRVEPDFAEASSSDSPFPVTSNPDDDDDSMCEVSSQSTLSAALPGTTGESTGVVLDVASQDDVVLEDEDEVGVAGDDDPLVPDDDVLPCPEELAGSSGMIAVDASESGPAPTAFIAWIVKVYDVPLVRPLMTQGLEPQGTVTDPGVDVMR